MYPEALVDFPGNIDLSGFLGGYSHVEMTELVVQKSSCMAGGLCFQFCNDDDRIERESMKVKNDDCQ